MYKQKQKNAKMSLIIIPPLHWKMKNIFNFGPALSRATSQRDQFVPNQIQREAEI